MTDDRVTAAILLDYLDGKAKEIRTTVALVRRRDEALRQVEELRKQIIELKKLQGETIELKADEVPE